MSDQIARAMTLNGKIRAVACKTTGLANEIALLKGTSPIVSIALGRALSGVALLGSTLKQGQRIAIKFEGNGPLKKMIVEAESDGAIRGTVANPDAVAETVPLLLGQAGFLTVTKDLGLKEPYSGTIQLYTSEIAEDIAYYLAESEQIASAVGLGVALADDGQIEAAGGFLIQSLPPSDNAAVELIMQGIAKLPSISSLLKSGNTPQELLELLLAGVEHHYLESTELFFRCGCYRKKVEKALISLGTEEIKSILKDKGEVVVTCEFCKQNFHFGKDELETIISI